MFKKGDALLLSDNNEYVVVDTYNEKDNNYIYLMDMNNYSNVFFGKIENDEIVEIKDADELEKVILRVYSNLHNASTIVGDIETS